MPKQKPSQKTQNRRGPITAQEILSMLANARKASDVLAVKYLILNADDKVYADLHRTFLALFNAVGCRSRLTGSR